MASQEADFETLLDYLRRIRGFDFTGYKRASLRRRVDKRMQEVDIPDYAGYLDYLEVHPGEFNELFNTILINVTGFFRDQDAWEFLSKEVVPGIIEGKDPGDQIRVWSAGCASGEEPFSLAMIFAEALGGREVQDRVKIYATDVDEEALAAGRTARFTESALKDLPDALREKYFKRSGGDHVFSGDLRRFVIFGRHDLVQDAPISRIDLLVCRNTLMYFNADTQSTILAKFHYALNDTGYLFLGKSEMLLTRTNLFVPVDLKSRVFIPVGKQGRDHSLISKLLSEPESSSTDALIKEAAFEHSPNPSMVVDLNRKLVAVNRRLRELVGITLRDLGRPLQDLEVSYRPVDLRSRIDLALTEGRQVRAEDAEWSSLDRDSVFEVDVSPTFAGEGAIGAVITFFDVTDSRRLRDALELANRQLETAYEELQSTVEELETTNEELQSTNEELETTNEELQSTNEELETTNEELQSTNDELESANEELRLRTSELNRTHAILESVLENHPAAIALLDDNAMVKLWNSRARDLWGLYPEEVFGRHFLNLDIGIPLVSLHEPIRRAMQSKQRVDAIEVEGTSRRGEKVLCRVNVVPIGNDVALGVGVFMEVMPEGAAGTGR